MIKVIRNVIILMLVAILIFPQGIVFAKNETYTITFKSVLSEFADGSTENVVTYDGSHAVTSGTYEEPTFYASGVEGEKTPTFLGWYLDQEGRFKADLSKITEDTTLYAVFDRIPYGFAYNGTDGTDGSVQIYTIPNSYGWQLETWGAQGGYFTGEYANKPGYGGYSTGYINNSENKTIYITVGGAGNTTDSSGATISGGYNGGGSATNTTKTSGIWNATGFGVGSGGGATSIQDVLIENGELKNYVNNLDNVLIVAGGSGGASKLSSVTYNYASGRFAGSGGGFIGGYGFGDTIHGGANFGVESAIGGTQTGPGYYALPEYAGYAVDNGGFGYGAYPVDTWGSGAGSGLYGGAFSRQSQVLGSVGAGGSGYIGNSNLYEKNMYIYTANTDDFADYQSKYYQKGIKPFESSDKNTLTLSSTQSNLIATANVPKSGNGYAKVSLNHINVTFMDTIDNIEYKYEGYSGLTFEKPFETKSGYTIEWKDKNGNTYDPTQPLYIDTVITLEATPIEYTIDYNVSDNAIVNGTNPTTYTIESETFTLTNPTPNEGYKFDGWKDQDGNISETVTIEKGSYGNKTYTAMINPIEYSITYNNIDENTTNNNPTTYTIESEDITLSEPEKKFYDFIGWTNDEIIEPTTVVTIESGSTGNKEYTANFETIPYTITYVLVTGITEDPLVEDYNTETEDFVVPNLTSTEPGYEFIGWTSEEIAKLSEPTKNVVIAKGSGGDATLTANFKPIDYTITLELNGGKVTGNNPIIYNVETDDFIIPNAIKEGYIFKGWTSSDIKELSTPTKDVPIAKGSFGNMTLIANYTKENGIEQEKNQTINSPKTGDNITKYCISLIISIIVLELIKKCNLRKNRSYSKR